MFHPKTLEIMSQSVHISRHPPQHPLDHLEQHQSPVIIVFNPNRSKCHWCHARRRRRRHPRTDSRADKSLSSSCTVVALSIVLFCVQIRILSQYSGVGKDRSPGRQISVKLLLGGCFVNCFVLRSNSNSFAIFWSWEGPIAGQTNLCQALARWLLCQLFCFAFKFEFFRNILELGRSHIASC
jgi:hypothetical protein